MLHKLKRVQDDRFQRLLHVGLILFLELCSSCYQGRLLLTRAVKNKEEKAVLEQRIYNNKMFKEYFTDGLIQIAIVLSILRTDLNSLNRDFVNYPEVQEIILGQTAAYTQTNFHDSINNRLRSSEIYRKDIDPESIFRTSFYRELRSFRPQRSRDLSYSTFLLVSGSNEQAFRATESADQNNNDNEDENNNIHSEQVLTSEELDIEAENLLEVLEENIGAIAPILQNLQGTEPTREVYL